jgi:hypothetical protein
LRPDCQLSFYYCCCTPHVHPLILMEKPHKKCATAAFVPCVISVPKLFSSNLWLSLYFGLHGLANPPTIWCKSGASFLFDGNHPITTSTQFISNQHWIDLLQIFCHETWCYFTRVQPVWTLGLAIPLFLQEDWFVWLVPLQEETIHKRCTQIEERVPWSNTKFQVVLLVHNTFVDYRSKVYSISELPSYIRGATSWYPS